MNVYVHADDDTTIRATRQGDRYHLGIGYPLGASILATPAAARRLRDRLSVALGDNGTSRVAGIWQGAVVTIDDHGTHQTLRDELVELDPCAVCHDRPATTTNHLDQGVCVEHATDDKTEF